MQEAGRGQGKFRIKIPELSLEFQGLGSVDQKHPAPGHHWKLHIMDGWISRWPLKVRPEPICGSCPVLVMLDSHICTDAILESAKCNRFVFAEQRMH